MHPVSNRFDGKVRQRRSRAFQPWAGIELGPKERASQAAVWPLKTLVMELANDPAALDWVDRIRSGESSEIAARGYVRRKGFTQEIVATVFAWAANSSVRDNRLALAGLATRAVFVGAPLDVTDPRQWGHASNDPLIARRIALTGAGRCVHEVVRKPGEIDSRDKEVSRMSLDLCGTRIAKDLGRSRRCSRHAGGDGHKLTRHERDEVTEFLHRVGRSLRLEK